MQTQLTQKSSSHDHDEVLLLAMSHIHHSSGGKVDISDTSHSIAMTSLYPSESISGHNSNHVDTLVTPTTAADIHGIAFMRIDNTDTSSSGFCSSPLAHEQTDSCHNGSKLIITECHVQSDQTESDRTADSHTLLPSFAALESHLRELILCGWRTRLNIGQLMQVCIHLG